MEEMSIVVSRLVTRVLACSTRQKQEDLKTSPTCLIIRYFLKHIYILELQKCLYLIVNRFEPTFDDGQKRSIKYYYY